MGNFESMRRAVVEACFYGHLFYGVCAAAQVVETSVQLALPFNGWLIATSFIGTVVFYSYPYTSQSASSTDPRVLWCRRHMGLVRQFQGWGIIALLTMVVWMLIRHSGAIRQMTILEWVVLLAIPGAAGLYYKSPGRRFVTLRQSGWLKPFVIGFVWAGVVVAYPVIFARLQYRHHTPLTFFPCLLFVKTLMFVAVLAILFDIKDREVDRSTGLTTVVTLVGLERTLFQVSLPLTMLGIAIFLSYATMQHLTTPRVVLVLTPFLLLVGGIVSLRRSRSILYYLAVIDGLMLAKAVIDIVAMHY